MVIVKDIYCVIMKRGVYLMCGRFYIDESIAQDLSSGSANIDARDYYPGENISVLLNEQGHQQLKSKVWGYSFQNKRIINARCETLFEKKMFCQDIYFHRCLIPCTGFYEWDAHKHKIAFENDKTLYMAGLYHDNEVVIITTKANNVMAPIHSRMPLILDKDEIDDWLFDDQKVFELLKKNNHEIKIVAGHFQQSLF